ncbi:hypothetical protein BDP27DRAFT_1430732 [Rhodocollybia butyracea]|uniref:Uncharacterized protein n=1 Tax=Rhodocollybia butyracea TaxID=206335 RepID=A0A9P5TZ49_9AGAR|nr:hypothetical protein BDP27DRAFT_1430732 [Rhodocollybia butyracea]
MAGTSSFEDKVGVGAVSNYLDTVMDPVSKAELNTTGQRVRRRHELRRRCRSADQQQVEAIRLLSQRWNNLRCRNGRPPSNSAPSPEGSASRLYTTKSTTNFRIPTPFPSPRLRSGSPVSFADKRAQFASSSVPPSSPCPVDSPSDHEATAETFTNEEAMDKAAPRQKKKKMGAVASVEQEHADQDSMPLVRKSIKKTKQKASAPAPAAAVEQRLRKPNQRAMRTRTLCLFTRTTTNMKGTNFRDRSSEIDLDIAEDAHIGIVLQEPRGDEQLDDSRQSEERSRTSES